ncbi:hypothetical protein PFLUV_G00061490 [Perca fluviatilis]|uniref:Uncharacterized protein n=1 Tax=Perca fluviatilis TaxID=8168 RepID=A0A6A5FFU4_PERFL|nr:hypothetical protein PFLUV_G00061490 [Perca fluviatilis]
MEREREGWRESGQREGPGRTREGQSLFGVIITDRSRTTAIFSSLIHEAWWEMPANDIQLSKGYISPSALQFAAV